jgi:predicted GNAT family acetyltransferase
MDVDVVNNLAKQRFDADVDGFVALVEYNLHDRILTLVHTEVPPELGGRGLGGTIVKAALEYAKSQGYKVVPQCPFARKFVERHEEYAEIVSP